jgi:hypothetical protein
MVNCQVTVLEWDNEQFLSYCVGMRQWTMIKTYPMCPAHNCNMLSVKTVFHVVITTKENYWNRLQATGHGSVLMKFSWSLQLVLHSMLLLTHGMSLWISDGKNMARPQKPDALPCLALPATTTQHMTHMSFLACLAFATAWQHDDMELSATCSCMLAWYSTHFTWRCQQQQHQSGDCHSKLCVTHFVSN